MTHAEELIDYAMPCMMAEKALKSTHNSMLDGNYEAALEHAYIVLAESRLMIHAINHMKEKQNGLRQQTASV